MNPDRLPFVFGLDLADDLMDALLDQAAKDCSEHGFAPVAICIVDARPNLVCAKTMDGTLHASVQAAYLKAVTAVNWKRNTVEFEHVSLGDNEWSSEPPLMNTEPDTRWSASSLANARQADPLFCSWAGGTLIFNPERSAIVGAVGVSGRKQLDDHKLSLVRPFDWGA